MLCWETMAVCFQIYRKHINTAVLAERRNVEFKTVCTYNDHWGEKC